MKILLVYSSVLIAILFMNFAPKEDVKPTVYTIGVSTVKNGSGKGEGGLWGWGDFIGQFLDASKVTM